MNIVNYLYNNGVIVSNGC